MLSRCAAAVVLMGYALAVSGAASEHAYPNKPIRIVNGGVGGASDIGLRLFVPGLHLGQPIVIDNRSSGVVPGEIVSRAAPDGYTLLCYTGVLWIGPLLQKTPYDALRDFTPVVWLTKAPNLVVLHPSLAAGTVRELIAYAKDRPGQLNYASGGTGASNHLAAELFKSMAGVNVVRIVYKSGATQMADLVGGQVQMMFANAGAVSSYVKAGRLKALAVTSAQPTPLFPALPTVAASGLPGYEAISLIGLWAPAGTSRALVERINSESVRVLKSADVRERFMGVGLEAVGSSPEDFAAYIKSDVARWSKVIRDAGIRGE